MPAPAEPELEAAFSGAPVRVLLVDDEAAISTLTSLYLERCGFQVATFNHPLAALKAFESDPAAYSIVVTDMTMPVISGVELAARIRTMRTDIPLVLLSGILPDDGKSHITFAEVLQKPVNLTALQAAIVRQTRNPRSGQ